MIEKTFLGNESRRLPRLYSISLEFDITVGTVVIVGDTGFVLEFPVGEVHEHLRVGMSLFSELSLFLEEVISSYGMLLFLFEVEEFNIAVGTVVIVGATGFVLDFPVGKVREASGVSFNLSGDLSLCLEEVSSGGIDLLLVGDVEVEVEEFDIAVGTVVIVGATGFVLDFPVGKVHEEILSVVDRDLELTSLACDSSNGLRILEVSLETSSLLFGDQIS